MSKKKTLPLLERIRIGDFAAEGKTVTKVDGLAVFAPYCAPGDLADLQVKRKKHSYAEAEAVRFHEFSPLREQPRCRHFGVCGGCRWQHIKYDEQLTFKRRQVEEQLRRIGGAEILEVRPTVGSRQTYHYRNKLDFGCCCKQWLTAEEMKDGVPFAPAIGFHVSGAFDKVLPITECLLMDDRHNAIRNGLRQFAVDNKLSFYDIKAQYGLLRGLIIRRGNLGEWMAVMQFGRPEWHEGDEQLGLDDMPGARAVMDYLAAEFPEITSLLWVYNPKCNDTFGDLPVHTYRGSGHITLEMDGLRFKVGPKSFYQTNTEQALRLYEITRDFAGLTGKELVYDLYTGTGTIANFVARRAKQVVGIEYVADAIADAEENSKTNGIDNTLFYAGDMKDILTPDFVTAHGRPDVIITDPPRAGMHPDVLSVILQAAPERIVYVSCNPATQARDLQTLCTRYRPVVAQPVDMFPHTPHVENVLLLQRID